ncbi:conjugal transfer protein TrbL family protein [Catellatospora sp. NPDC049111]|uniref:conjugal transfer protein TrbL family protein n=1 Tax=Catellatospora sp. NPDC049111 TaxID=3155271 RepID=UPI0033EF4E69
MAPQLPGPDIGDLIGGSPAQAMLTGLNTFLAEILLDVLGSLLDLLGGTVFTSPDVTLLPQVQQVTTTSAGVVNTCYVLAVITAGAMTMAGGVVAVRHNISELGSRLVVAFIGANFAAPLCSALIDLANALTAALTRDGIWAPQSLNTVRDLITASQADLSGTTAFLFTAVLVLIAVLAGLLTCQWIVRFGILIVLCAVAPVALACHGLPATDGAARAWWRSLLAALGTQVLQAVCLHLCVQVLLGPGAQLLAPAGSGRQRSVMHLLVVLVLLWGTAKIPALMRQYVTRGGGGGGPRLGSFLLRTVVLHRVTGLLRPGRGGGGRGPAQVFNIRNVTYTRQATPPLPPGRPGTPPAAGTAIARPGTGPSRQGPATPSRTSRPAPPRYIPQTSAGPHPRPQPPGGPNPRRQP